MKKLINSSRVLALATAGVLTMGVLLHPAPARADKAKNYKYGAIALGVVGGYLLSKGKTVEGAAVLGAGAYTYKKGEDARKADKYDDYRDRYGYNGGDRDGDRYGYGDNNTRDNYGYRDRNDNRNSEYRANRGDDRYRDDSRRNGRDGGTRIRVR